MLTTCSRVTQTHVGLFNEKFLIHRVNESSNSIFPFNWLCYECSTCRGWVRKLFFILPSGAYYFEPFAIFVVASLDEMMVESCAQKKQRCFITRKDLVNSTNWCVPIFFLDVAACFFSPFSSELISFMEKIVLRGSFKYREAFFMNQNHAREGADFINTQPWSPLFALCTMHIPWRF